MCLCMEEGERMLISNSEQNETHIWTQIGLKISTPFINLFFPYFILHNSFVVLIDQEY